MTTAMGYIQSEDQSSHFKISEVLIILLEECSFGCQADAGASELTDSISVTGRQGSPEADPPANLRLQTNSMYGLPSSFSFLLELSPLPPTTFGLSSFGPLVLKNCFLSLSLALGLWQFEFKQFSYGCSLSSGLTTWFRFKSQSHDIPTGFETYES